MSGGFGPSGRGPNRGAATRAKLGVNISKAGLRTGIAEAPGLPNSGSPGGRTAGARGEARKQESGAEPAASTLPQSKGPSGIDTGGSGTDLAAAATRAAAARKNRSRLARGGGLSNVRFGEATLG